MADDKKPKAEVFKKDHFQETLLFLVVLILLGALVERFTYYYSLPETTMFQSLWGALLSLLRRIWNLWKFLAIIIIPASIAWTIYNRLKLREIEKEEEKIYGAGAGAASLEGVPEEKVNEKWVQVIAHLNSNNPSEWRLAIIEADIMLDNLLRDKGYHGDTIGEMLKSVEPSDMLTLDAAWEAHKVRNRIAHSGADFELSEREAKRVVALFESVFKEFQII